MNTSYESNSVKSGLYKPTYARMEGQSEHGWGQRLYDDYTNKQLELYLTYDKKFADIHHLTLWVVILTLIILMKVSVQPAQGLILMLWLQ